MASPPFPSCSFAAATTWSVVKPKCWRRSFSGAEAPKLFIPRIFPVRPT